MADFSFHFHWNSLCWCHRLLLPDHSSSFVIRKRGSWLSFPDDFIHGRSPPLTCHHLSVTPGITSPCHHQSAQGSMLSMSSVSACMLPWFKPLMFCGLCFSEADWKWFYMVSKQTNNALHSKTLSRASSTSYAVEAEYRPNHCCPQKRFNEIRLLRHWIQAEMVLNYLSKQLGEVCFAKTSCAKKNWNKERAKKFNNTSRMLWFKAVLNFLTVV